MRRTIKHTYDARDIHPDERLPLPSDTCITITAHAEATGCASEPLSAGDVERPRANETFAEAVRRIRIDGPPDWSSRIDHYLYALDDGKA